MFGTAAQPLPPGGILARIGTLLRRNFRAVSEPTPAPAAIPFERLVGAQGWARLRPAVRVRFAGTAESAHQAAYQGAMAVVESSRAGWLLAQACRVIGTPLAPFVGHDVPTDVRLYPDGRRGGVVWERVYHFPGRAPIAVRSVKRLDRDGRLLECVGGGIGMKLQVYEADGSLHFESRSYFWQLLGLRLPIPLILTPGAAHVVHSDLDGRRFRFAMTFRHPWLGETFRQDGVFWTEGDLP